MRWGKAGQAPPAAALGRLNTVQLLGGESKGEGSQTLPFVSLGSRANRNALVLFFRGVGKQAKRRQRREKQACFEAAARLADAKRLGTVLPQRWARGFSPEKNAPHVPGMGMPPCGSRWGFNSMPHSGTPHIKTHVSFVRLVQLTLLQSRKTPDSTGTEWARPGRRSGFSGFSAPAPGGLSASPRRY